MPDPLGSIENANSPNVTAEKVAEIELLNSEVMSQSLNEEKEIILLKTLYVLIYLLIFKALNLEYSCNYH